MIAVKYYDDCYYDNEFYSKVGGISCKELNVLEIEMLSLLQYSLYVLPECYEKYVLDLKTMYLLDLPFEDFDTGICVGQNNEGFAHVASQSSFSTAGTNNEIDFDVH